MKPTAIFFISLLFFCQAGNTQNIDIILKGLTDDKQKADTLFSFGRRYLMKGKFDSSAYYLDMGIGYAGKIGDEELIAKFYIEKSNVLSFGGNYAGSLATIRKAASYIEHSNSYDLRNRYLILTGKYFKGMNNYDSALYYFQQCEDLNNRESPYRNWLVYTEMALMFQYAEAYEESEKYFLKAYTITKEKGIRGDYGVVLNQFADLYYVWDKPEKFAGILNEYDEFLKGAKKDYTKDPVHGMLFIDWNRSSLITKVEFMKNVRQELVKSGFIMNAGLANIYIAGFYEEANQPEEALKYIRENMESFLVNNDLNNLYINTKTAYRLLKKTGNYKEANDVAEKLLVLKDSIIRAQHRDVVLEMESKYQAQKKEQEITLLNSQKKLADFELLREMDLRKALFRENTLKDSIVLKEKINNDLLTQENNLKRSQLEKEQALTLATNRENIFKEKELDKEKKLRTILIGGALLLLIAATIILFQYRKQRSKNIVIQKQSDDMQVLMKEIHHRVKNNLQVISSLLDLQSMTIADDQASEAVKEGKNRVQSMALIHQNLYSEGNIKGIRAKEYINNLLQSLCDSYNISNDKIKVQTSIDDLNLDVDTMIPLGLILNELVSNSLKYAFKDARQGELSIILKQEPQHLFLKVSDNGKGYPEGLNAKESKSFGMKMIRAFAQKMKAKLDIYNNNGAVVEMHITKYNIA